MTEFKVTSKPIIAADLPYALETLAPYAPVKLFPPADANRLAEIMTSAINGSLDWDAVASLTIEAPFAPDWASLWPMLFADLLQTEA